MSVELRLNGLERWPELVPLEGALRRAAEAALGTADGEPPSGELSVTFLPDTEMRELNRTWLGRDRPTDVIAFPLPDPGPFLADVYIGVEEGVRNASELGIPVEEELQRLVIHGVLHSLGHEHADGDEREASAMFRIQEEILGNLRRR